MTDPSPFAQPGSAAACAPPPGQPALADAWGAPQRIDLARFDPPARRKIEEIAARVPRIDNAAVLAYGASVQAEANRFLDTLLDGVRTAEVGAAGDLVAELAGSVKLINIRGLKIEAQGTPGLASFAAALPLVGRYFSAFQRLKARHTAIVRHFERIEEDGRRQMAKLAAMDSRLESLVAENLRCMRELEYQVAAGQIILEREKSRFHAAREAALAARDPTGIAAVRDQGEQINAFEARLLRLNMALTEALLDVPQTRLTQSAGRIEYGNLINTLLFDLPRLKKAIVRLAALHQITAAAKDSAAKRALARQLEGAGIEALDAAYTAAKASQGGALEEIAAMGAIADRILSIVDKGAAIDASNRQARDEAARRLVEVREKFVDGLGHSTARAVRALG